MGWRVRRSPGTVRLRHRRPLRSGVSELADSRNKQIDAHHPRQQPHNQTPAVSRPCIQPIDPFARRDRRPHEAHYRNLSQYERNDVEDNKRCNRGTQPDICGKYGGYRRQVVHARYADRDTSNAGHPRGLAQHRVLNRLRQLLDCGKPFDTARRLLSAGLGGATPRGGAPPYPAAHRPTTPPATTTATTKADTPTPISM